MPGISGKYLTPQRTSDPGSNICPACRAYCHMEAYEGAGTLLNISGESTDNIFLDKINRMNKAFRSISVSSEVDREAVK